jgi:hypothetical protein
MPFFNTLILINLMKHTGINNGIIDSAVSKEIGLLIA